MKQSLTSKVLHCCISGCSAVDCSILCPFWKEEEKHWINADYLTDVQISALISEKIEDHCDEHWLFLMIINQKIRIILILYKGHFIILHWCTKILKLWVCLTAQSVTWSIKHRCLCACMCVCVWDAHTLPQTTTATVQAQLDLTTCVSLHHLESCVFRRE